MKALKKETMRLLAELIEPDVRVTFAQQVKNNVQNPDSAHADWCIECGMKEKHTDTCKLAEISIIQQHLTFITQRLEELIKPEQSEIAMILEQYADNQVESLGDNTLLMCLDTIELRDARANG